MNRNSRLFFLSGLGLVTLIFVITILFSMVWPAKEVWYMQNMSWLIPLIIVLFWAPVVPLILSNWDIHFYFRSISNDLIVIIANYGNTPFNFNRIEFASAKRYGLVGKKEFYPDYGLCQEDVNIPSNDTSFQELHEHRGYTLRRGLPITLTIRNCKAPENLCKYKKNTRVYLSLYYEGTKQRVYSQRIPQEIVTEIIQHYERVKSHARNL